MLSGKLLFLQRVQEEWKFQLDVFRSVLDWSVLVYLVVPLLIVFSFIYWSMWQTIDLYWDESIPFILLIGLLLLLLMRGNFRTFVYEADILFLLRHSSVFYSLKRWSFHYSLLQLTATTVFLVLLVLPILMNAYGYELKEAILLCVPLVSCRLFLLTIKKGVRDTFKKWFLLILFLTLFAFTLTFFELELFAPMSIVIMVGIYYFHLISFVKSKRFFTEELAIEGAERVRYIKIIFAFSMELTKTSYRLGKQPILFRHSKKLFRQQTKENGLLELVLKGFLRNKMLMSSYIQLIGFSLAGVILLPTMVKWIVFLIFISIVHSWLKHVYDYLLKSRFFEIVPYDQNSLPAVWNRFRRWIGIPSILFVGSLTIILTLFELLL
jgi:predicted ABC-type exoprotein transport system permease subunit